VIGMQGPPSTSVSHVPCFSIPHEVNPSPTLPLPYLTLVYPEGVPKRAIPSVICRYFLLCLSILGHCHFFIRLLNGILGRYMFHMNISFLRDVTCFWSAYNTKGLFMLNTTNFLKPVARPICRILDVSISQHIGE